MKRPSICAWIIAKNEERDLPRCLKSIEPVVDKVVLVDTGSTDKTIEVAQHTIDRPVAASVYLEASERGDDGEWRLMDFSKARNFAIDLAERTGCERLLWMDADDELLTPRTIARAAYLPPAAYGVWIDLGSNTRQVHHRLWPASAQIRFAGRCHEYPILDRVPQIVIDEAVIRHDATPHGSETSNARNLRILEAEHAENPNARTAFYLANTHKDAGRWKEAAEWYYRRIAYGHEFRDEYLFATLYLIRVLRNMGEEGRALSVTLRAIEFAPDWQEFRMELAQHYYKAKNYAECINEAMRAIGKPIPATVLWREPQMYGDQPARLISWCYEHMGLTHIALAWSKEATRMIGTRDADWEKREQRLSMIENPPAAPAIIKRTRQLIALHRPGAIGDILMTLNLIPALKAANPDAEIHYFCHPSLGAQEALGGIMLQAGVDKVMDSTRADAMRKDYDRWIDLIGYPMAEGYPYKRMSRHLLEYFADEMGVPITSGRVDVYGTVIGIDEDGRPIDSAPTSVVRRPTLPQLTLPRPKRPAFVDDRDYATVQIKAGWSKYKQWPRERWQDVFDALPHIPAIILTAEMTPKLADAIALVAHARLHVGIDSFANHLTNYLWTDAFGARRVPGVILWGSTQASAAGYPDNINISSGIECQPCFREDPAISRQRTDPCPNAHACMDRISVDEVVAAVTKAWERA